MRKTLYKLRRLSIIPSIVVTMGISTISAYADTTVEETLAMSEEALSDDTVNIIENNTIQTSESDEYSPEEQIETEDSINSKLETVAALTEQQVKEGYKMIDGKIYSPKDLTEAQIESGIHYGGVLPSTSTGLVAFHAKLPEGIHDDVYVTVIDVNTYETYQTVIYEVNQFVSSIHLPDGNYILSKCGLTADQDGRFFTESMRFTVNRGSYNVVNLTILDNQAPVKSDKQNSLEEGDANETVTGETESVDTGLEYVNTIPKAIDKYTSTSLGSSKPQKMSFKNLLFLIFSIGAPVFSLYRWIRSKK